jgi:3-oxoacyl-[acyl-carrier protein] reductase
MSSTRLNRSVNGLNVFITGAGSGIGRATAHLLAGEGARVAVTDITAERAQKVVAEIVADGGFALGWPLDLHDADAISSVVAAAAKDLGGIDIVVNNAGILGFCQFDAPDYEKYWEASLDIMLTAPMRVIRAALPHLRKSKSPRIVNLSSTEGLGSSKFNSAYSVAKHGVVGLTRALAVELGREGITVNSIAPGPINTAMNELIPENDKVIYAKRRTSIGRYGEPEEVAHAVMNFCLPSATYVTGTVLLVDGGQMARNG